MSETNKTAPTQLESGTYEIIQSRLNAQATDLRTRLEQLNAARREVFGAVETKLIANDRINTTNYCIARDIVAIGDVCLLGYNVHIGLRSGIALKDVFSVYSFSENSFHEETLQLFEDEKFSTDFQNLYRYYKEAFFAKFIRQGTYLYMVFQIGKNAADYKAFKWLVNDEQLTYIDNRSEHEIRPLEQHEFQWTRAHRDMQRNGQHPHVSILDRIFVETVGGDLTIKIEDNTDDGLGIYREDVEYKDQTLDDAEYFYADLGNLIALRIRPYQEEERYFVYNEKIQRVQRIDSLADSGVLLPDGHGLIFANGYYLQTGEFKIFDKGMRNMRFEQRITSPNGEDYLYVFYNAERGQYILLPYNIIEQKVETPILCHGYTLFADGELCYFRTEEDPTKHHVVQIWQTPFVAGESVPSEHTDSYLYKVGNKDIVRAMAECYEILTLTTKDDTYANLYDDLAKQTTDVLDSYYWIKKAETFRLDEPLQLIHETASSAIEEYDKKIRVERTTQETIKEAETRANTLFQKVKRQSFSKVDDFVKTLSELRALRGEVIGLKDLRYTNLPLIEQLETQAAEASARLSEDCVTFLLEDDALLPYQSKIAEPEAELVNIQTANEADTLREKVEEIGSELELLIDIVSNLKIADATQTTRIIDNISEMYAHLNQVKAAVRRRRKDLMGTEAVAEFNAQLKLLDQSIINYLDVAETPQKCDDYLTRLMVQVEELEGKFAEFDEFIGTLTEKREEIVTAFENKKRQLTEARNNRTSALEKAGERILSGITNRVKAFKEVNEINGFFASDLMADKVRDLIQQLTDLDDSNKANALQTSLKTAQEDAIRQLRDRQDLFVDGENVIRFGKHNFSVNVQPLDLTVVQREGQLYFHLTGTNFYEPITDERIVALKKVWSQALPSENEAVYRAEWLAYSVAQAADPNATDADYQTALREAAAQRYQEGYTKGIHDADAQQLLQALLTLENSIDLLAYEPEVRVAARLFWEELLDGEAKVELGDALSGAREVLAVFPGSGAFEWLVDGLEEEIE